MLRIFDSIFTEYVAHLRFRDIPPAYNVEYRKWLRYYLDFRNKYPVPNSKAERVRLFCDKLRKKRQTDAQRERAAHAVSAVSGRQAADETDDRGCEGAPFIPGGKTALTQNRAFSKAEGGRLKGKTMRDHTKLRAFELADEVVLIVYQITAKFPKKEQHGLTSQIRGAAVSVPSNIEEGFT
ncbi:MAG: four helix bundle protein, partial [Petrimonas sp.]|nr:four helix bundle protein [Petrimonas sp.]